MVDDTPLYVRYDEWPADLEERQELARELLGRHFVRAYDGWLRVAAQTFSARRPEMPSEIERGYLEWIETLSEEDRQKAYDFVCYIGRGIVFSVLSELDGVGGQFLDEPYQEQPSVTLTVFRYPRITSS